MRRTFISIIIFSCLGVSGLFSQGGGISEEVKKNIKKRVENGNNTGIVVGLITPKGTEYYSYGVKSLESLEPVNEHTVFEIGSISKTFTAILLADRVKKGELALDTPLQKLLPSGISSPEINGASIKLYHLSNHTSSLPGMPSNITNYNPENPYATYSEEQLYAFLNSYQLTRDIGSKFEYSNYATGLLGYVLAATKQTTYDQLMQDVIAKPLGMQHTKISLTSEMNKNLAKGHSKGIEVSNWDFPTLAGAGAIRSTVVDILKYIKANIGNEKTELYSAMQLSHQETHTRKDKMKIGLGWIISRQNGKELIWHNGGTGGYSSFTGFIKGENRGVIVLTNSNTSVDDIGMHLLQSTVPLSDPKPIIPLRLKKIFEDESVESAVQTYWKLNKNQANEYTFKEEELNSLGYFFLRKGDTKKALAVFKINVQSYPHSSNTYDSYGEAFLKNKDHEHAIKNYIKAVELNPGNTHAIDILKGLGVSTEDLTKKVVIENSILNTYVGAYKFNSDVTITIRNNNGQMTLQLTGQDEFPIYSKSENEFYLTVVQASVTFNKNKEGIVESLTLFEGGMNTTFNKN